MESGKTESQSILNQVACRNHWLDKRAMRGQRVCVRVTGPVTGRAYVQVSRALTDIRRAQRESLTLACRRTHSQQGEKADIKTVMEEERAHERKEIGAAKGLLHNNNLFFISRPVSRDTSLNPRSYAMYY